MPSGGGNPSRITWRVAQRSLKQEVRRKIQKYYVLHFAGVLVRCAVVFGSDLCFTAELHAKNILRTTGCDGTEGGTAKEQLIYAISTSFRNRRQGKKGRLCAVIKLLLFIEDVAL